MAFKPTAMFLATLLTVNLFSMDIYDAMDVVDASSTELQQIIYPAEKIITLLSSTQDKYFIRENAVKLSNIIAKAINAGMLETVNNTINLSTIDSQELSKIVELLNITYDNINESEKVKIEKLGAAFKDNIVNKAFVRLTHQDTNRDRLEKLIEACLYLEVPEVILKTMYRAYAQSLRTRQLIANFKELNINIDNTKALGGIAAQYYLMYHKAFDPIDGYLKEKNVYWGVSIQEMLDNNWQFEFTESQFNYYPNVLERFRSRHLTIRIHGHAPQYTYVPPAHDKLQLNNARINSLDGLLNIPNIENVTELDFWGNLITELKAYTFKTLTKLKKINLNDNKIYKIEDYAFGDLSQLTNLFFTNNKIQVLSEFAFAGLDSLQYLGLVDNLIEDDSLPTNILVPLRSLVKLSIFRNKISLKPDEFAKKYQTTTDKIQL